MKVRATFSISAEVEFDVPDDVGDSWTILEAIGQDNVEGAGECLTEDVVETATQYLIDNLEGSGPVLESACTEDGTNMAYVPWAPMD